MDQCFLLNLLAAWRKPAQYVEDLAHLKNEKQ
jgi:hypothetical protein